MDLTARALIVGGYLPPIAIGGFKLASRERIGAVWSELAPAQNFSRLQLDRGAEGVEFFGATPDDGLVIRPPLVQSRRRTGGDEQEAAGLAAGALASVARHLGTDRFLDVAVRTVCHLEGATPEFITSDLLGLDDDAFGALEPAEAVTTGVQYLVPTERGGFDVRVEPFEVQGTSTVLVTVEGTFGGITSIRNLGELVARAQGYAREAVGRFLVGHAQPAPQPATAPGADREGA